MDRDWALNDLIIHNHWTWKYHVSHASQWPFAFRCNIFAIFVVLLSSYCLKTVRKPRKPGIKKSLPQKVQKSGGRVFTLDNWHATSKFENGNRFPGIPIPWNRNSRSESRLKVRFSLERVFDVSPRHPMNHRGGRGRARGERVRLFEVNFVDVTAFDRREIGAIAWPRGRSTMSRLMTLEAEMMLHEFSVFFTLLTLTDLCLERHVARTDCRSARQMAISSPNCTTKLAEYPLRSAPARYGNGVLSSSPLLLRIF